MNQLKLTLLLTLSSLAIKNDCLAQTLKNTNVNYPKTKKVDSIDTYFNTPIKDPYRWLEDDRSPETEKWVNTQNETTFDYLTKIPYRETFRKRLEKLWNYEKITAPFKEGEYTYYYKNNGLQNQYVLYRKKDTTNDEIFLDPNTFAEDGTTSLSSIHFSKDGSLAAYSISEGGSDWRKIITINTESKKIIEDTLVDIKFSSIAWKGNEGFYYSSYDKPDGSELSAKTDQHKLYYHQLGTSQKSDKVIFGGNENEKHRYVGGYLTEDEKFLVITASESTSGNKLFIQNLSTPNSKLITILDNFDSDSYVIDNIETKLFIVTNKDAPNKKIVTTQSTDPSPKNWTDIIPETENVLSVTTAGNYFFLEYSIDAISKVYQHDYEGKLIREIKLPGVGSASGFNAKKNARELYFNFTNYNTPWTTYKYSIETGNYELYWKADIDFESNNYESKQIFYTSKDGTKIPMIITHKKGIKLNGKNPTILYGYGGFNISLTPSFSTPNAVWLEQGGIYAVANLRGGGEYGKKWHVAGTKLKKQNVFDDFAAAAQFLISNQYTSSDYLAIRGGSNGGLLVGATLTQQPNLAKVAICQVGVLDMLRYHTFTAGAGWAYDYGTAEESKEMFEYLKKYSPLHNIKKGIEYPATLVTTGDHDDRVVPAHSFKFAATLQEHQTGTNPTLIRIETNAGHGAGTPISKTIEQYADIFAFSLFNMGIKTIKKL